MKPLRWFFRIKTTAVLSTCIFIVKFEKYLAKHFKEKYTTNTSLTFIWQYFFFKWPVTPYISTPKMCFATSVWCITIEIYSSWIFTYFIQYIRRFSRHECNSVIDSWNTYALHILHNYMYFFTDCTAYFCPVLYNIKHQI